MNINTNFWNRIRYTVYTPFYDLIIVYLRKFRIRAIKKLNIQNGCKVLILGAGTGLDLKYLNNDMEITAVDITPSMIKKLNKRAAKLKLNVKSFIMDGQDLQFESGYFDYVILHLILAVIPDPYKTISEAARVLKPGGKISIFDKFLRKNEKPSFLRKFINYFFRVIATDLNRKLEDILNNTPFEIKSEEPVLLNGLFKIVIAVKKI